MADIKNLKIGNKTISAIYLGNTQIGKVYSHMTTIYDANDGIPPNPIHYSKFSDVLANISSWQVFGDSISYGYSVPLDDVWHEVIHRMDEYNSITKYNNSLIGSEISDGGRSRDSFCERYTELNRDVDLLTVFGGVNDWCHNNIPLGNYDDTTNVRSFYGALNWLIPRLKEQCPKAIIVWIIPLKTKSNQAVEGTNADGTNTFGLRLTDYTNAIIEKCRQYKIKYINLYGVEILDPDVHGEHFHPDGLHPNVDGSEEIAKYLVENGYFGR